MKAIIYDCDGVLVDSEIIYKASERSFLKKVGLTYDDAEFFRRFMGRSEDSFFAEAASDHLSRHGRPLPDDFRASLLAHQRAEFERRLDVIAGMPELLTRFAHVPAAVASSSATEILQMKLKKTGLLAHFGEHVYSALMVGKGKPEPDLFLHAAAQIKMAPEDCIVIEDSENGVWAGLAANMKVIGFTGGGHCPPGHAETLSRAGAHHICANAGELGAVLQEWLLRKAA